MIARVDTSNLQIKLSKIDELCRMLKTASTPRDQMEMVALIKEVVSEFRSPNSIFEVLDGKSE